MERLQPLPDAARPVADSEPEVIAEPAAATVETAPVYSQDADADAVTIDAEAAMPEASVDGHAIQSDSDDVASTDAADAAAETAPERDVAGVTPAIAPAAPTPRVPRSIRWPSASARRRLAIASVPLLAILLLLQSLLADRAHLAADARWRPLMVALCDALSCTLPPWREPAAFTLLDRDVRPDPHRPGVLHVSAGFRNDARWSQPLPALLLTLSDADGRVAGARAFRPEDYLAAPATQNSLASGQSAKVSFDVVEPTRDVVAFTFDFR